MLYCSLILLLSTQCGQLYGTAVQQIPTSDPANIATNSITTLPASEISNETSVLSYSHLNASCSHCFMGHPGDFHSSVFDMLANGSFSNYSNSNENCSRCFEGIDNQIHEDTNRTKLVGCMCGLFTTQNPSSNDFPLRTKSFHNVTCHELVPDEDACKKVCMFAALAHNEMEPDNICSHLNHASSITAYVESKICQEDTQWVFTGLASPTPTCCLHGNPVNC